MQRVPNNTEIDIVYLKPLMTNVPHHIETSQLIIDWLLHDRTLVINGLNQIQIKLLLLGLIWKISEQPLS